mmetsp:Transcript_11113/g.19379  ORF Transcript_11113/g.19379 Transcript_11113/m.19379 type:complete len:299 (+) Transcript_11113:1205-2101(+)
MAGVAAGASPLVHTPAHTLLRVHEQPVLHAKGHVPALLVRRSLVQIHHLIKRALEEGARHHQIQQPMLQQVLCSLEVIRQILCQCLLNHAPPCKADDGLWFCDDEIPQHAERSGHTPSGWAGEDGDVKKLCLVLVHMQSCADLGHLHQGHDALLHASSSRSAHDEKGQALVRGVLDQSCELLTDHTAHGPAHVAKLHHAQRHWHAMQQACACAYSVLQPCLVLSLADAVNVGLHVCELKGIHGRKGLIHGTPGARINQVRDALLAGHFHVVVTTEADVVVLLKMLDVEDDTALVTACP